MTEPRTLDAGQRLAELAAERGDAPAVWFVDRANHERTLSWRQLETQSTRTAHRLMADGVDANSIVVIALPSSPNHLVATYAAWKLGACVLPLSHRAPVAERVAVFDLARSARPTFAVGPDELPAPDVSGVAPLPPITPAPDRAIASGGTTGTPKLTMEHGICVLEFTDGRLTLSPLQQALGLEVGHTQLVCTPLYHSSGFAWTHTALAAGNPLVLFERFDASAVLRAVERHRVNQSMVVPEVMRRLLDVPEFEDCDLSSWTAFGHGGAPCPAWLKRRWLERLGAENVYEGLGATESIGATVVRGDTWLKHPGTVGRPVACQVQVRDESDVEVEPGVVGRIFMRPIGATAPTFGYLGDQLIEQTDDGFVTLGDLGSVDADGFVYLADRRADLIITGGANVYPAEVEAALSEHLGVHDVAVIGLADDVWGQRVHAVIVPATGCDRPDAAELGTHCRALLTPYKVPKTYEFVDELPRTDIGKLRRRQLRQDREPV